MDTQMNFLIIGAGGIGCYYGARLQSAGHSVSYLARGEHLRAMQQKGLQVKHKDMDFLEEVDAFDIHQLLKTKTCKYYDLIILTTKSGATLAILAELKDWLNTASTPFISLQNGVDNESLIAEVVGIKRTLGGLAVRIGGHIVAPGKIDSTGKAELIIGVWPRSIPCSNQKEKIIDEFAKEFNYANIPTRVSSDIQQELWRKLLINNGVNPLSALTGLDTRMLTSHPIFTKRVYQMMEEVANVAKADNVVLTQKDVDEMYDLICTFEAIKTSMLIDKEKGRPLELDSICGAVLRRASKLGIEAPTTELINALLLMQESVKQ